MDKLRAQIEESARILNSVSGAFLLCLAAQSIHGRIAVHRSCVSCFTHWLIGNSPAFIALSDVVLRTHLAAPGFLL